MIVKTNKINRVTLGFVGLFVLGIFTLFYIYKLFRNKMNRNNNLNKNQFKIASNVFKYLKTKKRLIQKKISNFNLLEIKKDLINLGVTKIDYIELYNSKTLKQPKNKREKFKIFIAFYLNKTRLIDNI